MIDCRLRINDEKNSTGFTGDIPLHMNKHLPWLVKGNPNLIFNGGLWKRKFQMNTLLSSKLVPINGSDYFTCWVRILRENIPGLEESSNPPQRMLISIWPIFEITSMLTCPIHFTEIGREVETLLPGAGGKYTMEVPATHLTNHILKFNYP